MTLRRAILPLLALGLTVVACTSTVRETQPERTATEQLIVSGAIHNSVAALDLSALAGKSVFLDSTWFDGVDRLFALGELREALLRAGARLVPEREQALLVAEPRSSAVGINRSDWLLGIPEIPLPIPLVGTVSTPELALAKNDRQRGVAGLALLVYERVGGTVVHRGDPVFGETLHSDTSVLFIPVEKSRDGLPEQAEP